MPTMEAVAEGIDVVVVVVLVLFALLAGWAVIGWVRTRRFRRTTEPRPVPTVAAEPDDGARTRATIWLATLVIIAALTVYGCGPEALCILEDGSPVSNAFGAHWCERDGLPGPTRGDTSLAW